MKKILGIVLTLALGISMFAGCNKPGNTSSLSNSTGSSSASIEETYKAYYLHWITPEDLPGDKLIAEWCVENVNVEPVCLTAGGGSTSEKKTILFASNDPFDFTWGNWPQYAKTGAIVPLNEYLKEGGVAHELFLSFPADDWASRTDKDGNIWGIPIANFANSSGIRIRTDWLKTVGLPLPTTLDEFEKVLAAFKSTEALGADRVVMASQIELQQLERAFAGLFVASGTEDFKDTDGQIKPAIFDPGYEDFVAKMADWYSKGYFWKEGFIQKYDTFNDFVAQNKVGILATWDSVGQEGIVQLQESGKVPSYDYMQTFTGPKGTAYTQLRPGIDAFIVAKKSKDPEKVMKLINFLNKDVTNKMTSVYGFEGTDWEWVDEGKQIFKSITETAKIYSGKYNFVQGSLDFICTGDDIRASIYRQAYGYSLSDKLDVKKPFDTGIVYDMEAIQKAVPTYSDLEKYRDEQLTKFVIGQRPMSEWGDFISELLKIGFDKTIAVKTAQYNAAK